MVKPKAPTLREQQLAEPAAFPGVGPVLAARLLDGVGGRRAGLAADAAALRAVPVVGDSIAAGMRCAPALRWCEQAARRRRGVYCDQAH